MPATRLIPAALVAALVAVAAPAASAADWSVRSLPVAAAHGHRLLDAGGWQRSGVIAAPTSFRALGLTWSGIAPRAMEVRTARAWAPFGPWQPLEPNADGAGSPESSRRRPTASEPLWIGRAERVQVRTRGASSAVRVVVIDPGSSPRVRPRKATRADVGGVAQPTIISRAQWGADESLRGKPRYAPTVRFAVVHHTAGSNDYSQADAPAVVRSIYLYHTKTLGWSDIGYAFLVDRFGTVYEGRAGGITRPVIGAHVYGFNTGSTSVSLMGSFDRVAPSPELMDATARLLAWRLDVAHLDPAARVTTVSGGGDRFAAGVTVQQPMIAAHRDYGATACPGALVYAQLDALRAAVAAVPGLRIWDPRPQPLDAAFADGPIRVSARLSAPASWTVSILDPAGTVIASGAGAGGLVDYTWPGPGVGGAVGDLTYRIEASAASGPARPATGRLDGRDLQTAEDIPSVPLADVAAKPRILTPNGDGNGDTLTLAWRQGVPARVSVWVDDALGAPLFALSVRDLQPGSQQIGWGGLDPAGIPLLSGRYTLRLVLEQAGAIPIVQTTAVDLRRGAANLGVTRFVSPNGDGRAENAQIAVDRVEGGPLRVRVVRGTATVATLLDTPSTVGPQRLTWDPSGVPDGLYRLLVDAPAPGGTLVLGAKVTVDRTAPRAQVVSVRRRGRAVRVVLRFSETVVWHLQSRRTLLRAGERAGKITIDLPRRRIGRTMTLYLRDRAGTPAKPIRIWRP